MAAMTYKAVQMEASIAFRLERALASSLTLYSSTHIACP